MAHRVNIMLDDFSWRALKKAPKGERSQIVNSAVAEWFKTHKRAKAAQKMDKIRQTMPTVPTKKIVAWLRTEREKNR